MLQAPQGEGKTGCRERVRGGGRGKKRQLLLANGGICCLFQVGCFIWGLYFGVLSVCDSLGISPAVCICSGLHASCSDSAFQKVSALLSALGYEMTLLCMPVPTLMASQSKGGRDLLNTHALLLSRKTPAPKPTPNPLPHRGSARLVLRKPFSQN